MEKSFKALIEEIQKEAARFKTNNDKLHGYIMQIFYIDELDDSVVNPHGAGEIDKDTVEVKFKRAISLIKKENERYERYLQTISGWLK